MTRLLMMWLIYFQQPPGTVSVSSDIYNMNHKRRGKALIINQENFSSALKEQGFGQRVGTNVDAKNLRFKLEALGEWSYA